jgi:uncharacterized protein
MLPGVWVLLPPSEGKFAPSRGRPLDLSALSSPELTQPRGQVLDALVTLCREGEAKAMGVLDLSPGLSGEIARNAGLREAPAAPAGRIYQGVLYDALGLESLSGSARRRACSRLLVCSSLFGVVRLADRIPAYRLSGDVSLPGVGTVASVWRAALSQVMERLVAKHLVVDLRSGVYAGFWRPTKEQSKRVVSLRVLHEAQGRRTVVSHFNKATKGRIVRDLLEDGAAPMSARGLVTLLNRLGWQVEPTPGNPHSYDVVAAEI